jgi:hypothetical protein
VRELHQSSSPNTDASVLVHGTWSRLEPFTGTERVMRNCWRVIFVVLFALLCLRTKRPGIQVGRASELIGGSPEMNV